MKNDLKLTALCLIMIMLLQSCYTVQVAAPTSSKVELANKGETLPITVTKRQWFLLWGLAPISKDKTDETIAENGFTKVRVTTKTSFLDGMISIVLGVFTIGTRTVVIEGEQAAK